MPTGLAEHHSAGQRNVHTSSTAGVWGARWGVEEWEVQGVKEFARDLHQHPPLLLQPTN